MFIQKIGFQTRIKGRKMRVLFVSKILFRPKTNVISLAVVPKHLCSRHQSTVKASIPSESFDVLQSTLSTNLELMSISVLLFAENYHRCDS